MKKALVVIAVILLAAAAAAVVYFVVLPRVTAPEPEYPKNRTVCIDAGHGGKDVGAVLDERYEKDDNLRLALAAAEALTERGFTVVMTRTEDVFVELADRCEIANSADAALFVSFHRNSAEAANAKGFEVWTSSDAGTLAKDLSRALLSEIKTVGISSDRGVKFGTQASPLSDYTVNRLTEMPSCILEMGFITSETDNGLFDENLNAYAEAVARAVESLYPKEK